MHSHRNCAQWAVSVSIDEFTYIYRANIEILSICEILLVHAPKRIQHFLQKAVFTRLTSLHYYVSFLSSLCLL